MKKLIRILSFAQRREVPEVSRGRVRRAAGFTLVEIMIVVAIIILIAALAIPNLLRSRLNANEAGAIASLKTISWGAQTFRAGNPSYPANLSDLSAAVPAYIDTVLGSGLKQGYSFTFAGDANTFNCTAAPVTPNITGVRTFFVDASGVIRANETGIADASSPPV